LTSSSSIDKYNRGKLKIVYPLKKYKPTNPSMIKIVREDISHKKKQVAVLIILKKPNLRMSPLIPYFGLNFKHITYELYVPIMKLKKKIINPFSPRIKR